MIITVDQNQSWAPCCYLICQVSGEPGSYDWNEKDEASTVLCQSDWERPSIAKTFGWTGADDDIDGATEYLDELCEDFSPRRFVDDPGYFDTEAPR